MTTIAAPHPGYRDALAAINDLSKLVQTELAAERGRIEAWRALCSRPSE